MPRQSDTPASWTPTAGAGGLRRPDSDCRNLCGHRVSLRRPAQVAAERLQQFCQEGGDVADHASELLLRDVPRQRNRVEEPRALQILISLLFFFHCSIIL